MLIKEKILLSILQLVFLWSCSNTSIVNNSVKITNTNKNVIVKTGLDVLLESQLDKLLRKKIALVTNHSVIDKNGKLNISRLLAINSIQLVKIFTPEHGFFGVVPDGEYIENDSISSELPPVISLYGKTRKPTRKMLANIDLIIYDIQDVGARFYTYISTLGLVMEAAGEANILVIVVDRPNPIGGYVDGPILDQNYKSFIGKYPIPIQYGMTVGELAKMIVGEKMIDPIPQLTVIPMENYCRNYFYDETQLQWTNPSPNILDLETAIIYPGFCIFEAINVSEGRGTYTPFKQIGAPWINADSLINLLNVQDLPGVIFNPIQFTPKSITTMSKYPKFENQNCNGIRINITERDIYKNILTGVTVLWAINELYPDSLVINRDSLGRIWGSDNLYLQLREGKTPSEIIDFYQPDLKKFIQIRTKYLIYK
ncbi:MAG: DUF1343 domain-containing protein [Planctomycetia bacterium]|nr:DUF1343 domain-containing protein [Planctomycetia bacterium]